jgi:outer membrane protein assembly factor BamB
MSHASILPMTYQGRKMYVYCAAGGVVGVDAGCGAILWETDAWKISIATVPTPVVIGDGRLLLSGGYDSGGAILQLKEEGAGRTLKVRPYTVQIERRFTPQEFGSDQHTPIFYQGYVYGVIPGGQLVCMDPSGRQLWASGSTRRFGLGPYLAADGMLLVLNDTGTLTLVEANPKEYKQLAQARILTGHDSWGPLALADRYLLARDLTKMVCVDVGRM